MHPEKVSYDAISEATAWLKLPATAQAAVKDGLEHLRSDPSRAQQLEQMYQAWVLADAAHAEAARQWPLATQRDDAMRYALLVLSGVPGGKAALERRGLPDAVVRDAFLDVHRRFNLCHKAHGFWGIEKPHWLSRHLRGRLVELGRMQYEVGFMGDRPRGCDDPALPRALEQRGLSPDTPVWWLHIPSGDSLTPERCEASYDAARTLLPRHFTDHPARVLVCDSWMLDTQLRDYLSPDANLIRFLDGFDVIHQRDSDGEFRKFVPPAPLNGTPTSLQRADIEHKCRGGTWRIGLGVARFSL